jgi:hypothetical protein
MRGVGEEADSREVVLFWGGGEGGMSRLAEKLWYIVLTDTTPKTIKNDAFTMRRRTAD